MKILLVDDDAFLRDMYATKFTELQHEIDVAENGEDALRKLHTTAYDVVLVDMVMPQMNGLELLEKIKTEEIVGKPACIMLTNQSEEHDKEAAAERGAIGYIVKAEFIPSEVAARVIEIMNNKTS